jgi:hypothetical protein
MEPQPKAPSPSEVVVLLVSGSCCVPQMTVLDQQAQQIIRQALEETGITAQVRTLLISSALQGGIPAEILKQLEVSIQPANLMRLPALFINGKLISLGLPELNQVKSALLLTQSKTITKEGI